MRGNSGGEAMHRIQSSKDGTESELRGYASMEYG